MGLPAPGPVSAKLLLGRVPGSGLQQVQFGMMALPP